MRTRWPTLAIIPRTAGGSGRVRRRLILLSPRPSKAPRGSAGRRMGLAVCSTVMVFSAVAIASGLRRLGIGLAAPRLQRRDLDAAARGDAARAVLVLERIE